MRSVKRYYNKHVVLEWNRLVSNPYRKLELDTTLYFLKKYLPRNGLILDAGGGPGRYTIELARRNYDLVLSDLASANLEFARRQIGRKGLENKVVQFVKGSVEDLSILPDASFDSVLCLGPLSHIMTDKGRNQAIRELVRVTKSRKPIFVSVISRLGSLVSHLTHLNEHIAFPFFKTFREHGDYHGQYRFTATHTFLPDELKQAFAKQRNLKILEMVGLEGLGSGQEEKVKQLSRNKKLWKAWLETHYRTCTHPAIVGMSEHMMLIARKV